MIFMKTTRLFTLFWFAVVGAQAATLTNTPFSALSVTNTATDDAFIPIIQKKTGETNFSNFRVSVADLFSGRGGSWPGLAADYPWTGQHTFETHGLLFGSSASNWWGSPLTYGETLIAFNEVDNGDPDQVYMLSEVKKTSESLRGFWELYSSLSSGTYLNLNLNQSSIQSGISSLGDTWQQWTVGTTNILNFQPFTEDGTTAVAYEFNTFNQLTNSQSALLAINNRGSRTFSINSDGSISLSLLADKLWITGSGFLMLNETPIGPPVKRTPGSSSETNYVGSICFDDSYLYIWTATNVNKRAALSTW